MGELKTKSIKELEQRMQDVPSSTLRHQILRCAKSFKTSWIDLGQALYAVWKDKLYKEWGYNNFDAYTTKEVGIRKPTALKLLRSYYFLEKEEPLYLKEDYCRQAQAAHIPTYESIDALRLASKRSEIGREELAKIKREVLEKGKDAAAIKKDLTRLIRQREELLPEEAWQKKRLALIKRCLSLLKSLREEIKIAKMLPMQMVKDIDKLIANLESELPK